MLKIKKPGLLSTVQDLGRYGFQKHGVIVSGAMDSLAHRISNLLVGNEEIHPTIEFTLLGPVIEFTETTLISICGATMNATIDGQSLPLWRPVLIKKGSELRIGQCQDGCRAYIAIAGGLNVSSIMNSKSTYLRAEIGGFKGRALKPDDELKPGQIGSLSKNMIQSLTPNLINSPFTEMEWTVASELIPTHHKKAYIRVTPGRQYHLFSKDSLDNFFNEPFNITAQSDRMGYRLEGPRLKLQHEEDMISEAVSFGTIQVPSNGNPIILLADRQTIGGYPKIAQVATADLPYVAQLKPGDRVAFKEITVEEAQKLYLKQEWNLQQLKQGIALKLR
ncbi:antagonist of KipI [Bacillus pakistanensis]|uniref:Antagonist of KipI n=1 Tax=Rossellomorea pakistanensis TaxID=992288 RepID=A0ABS2NIR8_9BACI|nr:biotin-dependent carboxyltransferase family protein [Bacillus pakistanensis]MBM7587729.1 antagonist of KipI [Bacillus pakistanensis]